MKLTQAGKEHLQKAREQTRAYIADLLDSLSDEQIAQIDKGLALLKQVFEDSGAVTK